MRIGYLYDLQAYPPRGGNHVHVLELIQGFLEHGHSVCVVSDPTMPGVTTYGDSTVDLQRFVNEIDVLYVRIDARFTHRWMTLNECVSLVGNRPVVWEINAPANEALAFSWLGGKVSASGFQKEGFIRWLRRWFHAARRLPGIAREERHRSNLAKRVSSAICVSAALRPYAIQELGISDVLILPNGGPLISEVEISQRRERRQEKGFTVLYSGSATYPWQGLDVLSRVIALAEREAPDLKFILAVNQRIPGLPTSCNVVIRERLNRDEILDAICAADACVALDPDFHWSKWGFHGSPMKLFEYMACMQPVVTSDHGQMQEILQDGNDALLCSDDPSDILSKLLSLRDNPDMAAAIGHQAWERVQSDYNWPRNVAATLNMFQRALNTVA